MLEPTPEAWALIRHAYEHTDQPLAHICAEHEITTPMLRYRMKKWDWRRRKTFVPRQGPAAVALVIAADTCFDPPLHGEDWRPTSQSSCEPGWGDARVQQPYPTPLSAGEVQETNIVPRLQSAVARVLPAIEATVARLAAGSQHPREMEQAGRTLSSLTRALRELNALVAQHNAQPAAGAAPDDDPIPENIDEFRFELARRIEALIAQGQEEAAGRAPGEQG